MALTIAAPVMGGAESGEVIAAVVAVVSFQEVFASVQQPVPMSERELLERGNAGHLRRQLGRPRGRAPGRARRALPSAR